MLIILNLRTELKMQNMSFSIGYGELLEKYKIIWIKIEDLENIK